MKKHFWFVLMICLLLLPLLAAAEGQQVSLPQTEQVRILGRCLTSDEGLYLSWTCSGVEFTFTGTEARACIGLSSDADAPVLMGVFVDEEEECTSAFLLESTDEEVVLAEALEDEEHTLRLLKLSEARHGNVVLKSLWTDGGDIAPTEQKERLIEFVGDSITCGYGTLASEPDAPFLVEEEDGSLTYAYLLAQYLDADFRFVSTSGIGVYRNNNGDEDITMPVVYPYVQYHLQKSADASVSADQLWADTPHAKADLVVLHLGTNDETAIQPDDAEDLKRFQQCYTDFLRQVRQLNPQATILVTYGVMKLNLAPYIDQAVADYISQTGDEAIVSYTYDFLAKNEMDGMTAGHPSAFSHEMMADALYGVVCQLMDWE